MSISINFKLVSKASGLLLFIETGFMFLSMLVSLFYKEDVMTLFVPSLVITFLMANLLFLIGWNAKSTLGVREGFLIVSLAWVLFSFFGSLPFYLSGCIPTFESAFFETVSGFTTTGNTMIKNVEILPYGILFWRSLTHWMGGMGIVIFTIAFLPLLKTGGLKLFSAESTGPMLAKIHPRISDTSKRLWYVYIFLTVLEIILLCLEGMGTFDSVCQSFGTLAGGGFSTKNASIGFWPSPIIHYTIIVFMFCSGVNFILLYFLLKGQLKRFWDNEELKWFLGFTIVVSLIIGSILYTTGYGGLEKSFRDALFQVSSAVTTTGYSTVNFMAWDPLLWSLLLLVMIIGGSAGSTAGGAKVVRVLLALKNIRNDFRRFLHPNAVIPVRMDRSVVSQQVITNSIAFLFAYFLVILISTLVLLATGMSFVNSVGSTISSISNVGLAIGDFPSGTYADIPVAAKWYLSFLMLVGRLELYTLLMIFTPYFWRD